MKSNEEKRKKILEEKTRIINGMKLTPDQKQRVIDIISIPYLITALRWKHQKEIKTELDIDIEELLEDIERWRGCDPKRVVELKKELTSLLKKQKIQNEPIERALRVLSEKNWNCNNSEKSYYFNVQ